MLHYIGTYTSTCDMCLQTKPSCQAPMSEMHPLPIPKDRWSMVLVDFILELPGMHDYNAIIVVVYRVGKRAHFIPTTATCSALGTANLYCKNVWKLHSLYDVFVSNQGPQFVAEFTRELYQLLGIKLQASTAYHPQSNGQTEHIKQELEQYPQIFCSKWQDNWDELLSDTEF